MMHAKDMGRWVQVLNRFSSERTNHSNFIDEKAYENIKFCLLFRQPMLLVLESCEK